MSRPVLLALRTPGIGDLLKSAASIDVVTLLRKPEAIRVDLDVRYLGYTASERPVVGYGLGHRERHRSLPDIRFLAA